MFIRVLKVKCRGKAPKIWKDLNLRLILSYYVYFGGYYISGYDLFICVKEREEDEMVEEKNRQVKMKKR